MCWFQNSKPAPSVVVITATPWSTSFPFPGTWPFTSFPASAPSVTLLRRLVFLSSIVVRIGAVFTHFFLIWSFQICVRHVQLIYDLEGLWDKTFGTSPLRHCTRSLLAVRYLGPPPPLPPQPPLRYQFFSIFHTRNNKKPRFFFDACSISWFIPLG